MHFIDIANTLAGCAGLDHDGYVYNMADVMARYNLLFDRAWFISAAGGTPEPEEQHGS
jgi:hypothetical protein